MLCLFAENHSLSRSQEEFAFSYSSLFAFTVFLATARITLVSNKPVFTQANGEISTGQL
jgi:hypothetical protein